MLALFAAAAIAATSFSAAAQNPPAPEEPPARSPAVWKDVAPGAWRWMEDYLVAKTTYVVGCPHNRKCEAGTGVYFRDEPRGSRQAFSGDVEMLVVGAGALYVRVLDGDTPVRVGFYRKSTTLIPIYR